MTRVTFQPSPFDRLDPAARAIRWWTSQMSEMLRGPQRKVVPADALSLAKSRLPKRVLVTLSEMDGFSAQTRLPKGSADEHQKAIVLRAPDLAPIETSALSMFATAIQQNGDGGVTYEIAMARKTRLDQLEAEARRRGAKSVRFNVGADSCVEILSPRGVAKASRASIVDASIFVGLVVAAVSAVSVWTARINYQTEAFANEERSIRRAAVATEAARGAGEVSRQLVERGILTRRGAAAVDAIAVLSVATPDNTWWTRLRWAPAEINISGQSPDATAAITALSTAAKAFSFELAGPLNSASSDGLQSFDVIAKPRIGLQR